MEMEINVINNKIFTNLLKNKSKRKRNFIYHFLVKSKPHERIDLLITACVNIYQKKKYSNSNENMLFLRKTDETIWNLPIPLSKRKPLSSNPPYFWAIFSWLFMTLFFQEGVFVQISKARPPIIFFFLRRGNYVAISLSFSFLTASWIILLRSFKTFVILPSCDLATASTILLPIKSPAASAVFWIALFETVLSASVADYLVWSRSFGLICHSSFSLYFY